MTVDESLGWIIDAGGLPVLPPQTGGTGNDELCGVKEAARER